MPKNTTHELCNYIWKSTIHTSYISTCRVPNRTHNNLNSGHKNLATYRSNRFQGIFKDRAKKRLAEYIDYFVATSPTQLTYCKQLQKSVKFRVNFITLTLPSCQIHSDETIKSKCLSPFLQELSNKHQVDRYLWKAERQSNGNIHFHVTINKFIHYSVIQHTWNRIVNKLGYVDRFQNKHGHRNPHSTEIKSVKNVKRVAAYLAAYLTSKKKNDLIKGRFWSVSESISKYHPVGIYEDNPAFHQINKIIAAHNPPHLYTEHFSLHFLDICSIVQSAIDHRCNSLILELCHEVYTPPDIYCMIEPDYILNGLHLN